MWGAAHLPQDRDVLAAHAGDGSVALFKYCYPDQRRVKAREGVEGRVRGACAGPGGGRRARGQ